MSMNQKEKVKILGINGSPRHATTEWAVEMALKAAESMGYVETELVSLGDYDLKPCTGCMKCFGWRHPADEGLRCYEWNDGTQALMEKLVEMDGLIFGMVVYTHGINSLARILMEKCHMFGPQSFGRGAHMLAYKPAGGILVGGQNHGGQEGCLRDFVDWVMAMDMHPVGAWPTRYDPNPVNSTIGGIVSSTDSRIIYGKNALSKEACRTVPPTMGSRNERTLRNVGRNVAFTTLMAKLGRQAVREHGFEEPDFQSFVQYSVKPMRGSWVDKLMKEGKVKYVNKGSEGEEYKEPDRLSAPE
jgi:multimeric flavodoxin WrbA